MKIIVTLIIALCLVACGKVDYQEVPGVDKEVNEVGKIIAKFQRSEVWTGGNEYSGCYTWEHREKFLKNKGLERIAAKAKGNRDFMRGIVALKRIPTDKQNEILKIWGKPIDPTWRQTGRIGDGTTEAGWETERDIAETLTKLAKNLLSLQ
ncbi:hypothetical protein FJZ31_22105 [Candidatus Poribacteria bacterium]|nr:hypothetical protein [Candidatus Poribacteria bacterium]